MQRTTDYGPLTNLYNDTKKLRNFQEETGIITDITVHLDIVPPRSYYKPIGKRGKSEDVVLVRNQRSF